jgi:hypothetical protein
MVKDSQEPGLARGKSSKLVRVLEGVRVLDQVFRVALITGEDSTACDDPD